MPVAELKSFLDKNRVKYRTIVHSRAYTAQEIAAVAHVPGNELAKVVMVKLDDRMAMAVLPSSHRLDRAFLARMVGVDRVELASESEFADLFPGCEVGAMPPFGNLWDIPVYVSNALARQQTIAFNAGSHVEVMRLAFSDFNALVEPRILDFSSHL